MTMELFSCLLIFLEGLPWLFTPGIALLVVILISRLFYHFYAIHTDHSSRQVKQEKVGERKMDFFESVLDELHALGGANICCGVNLKSKSSLSYGHVYDALKCVSKKYPLLRTVIVKKYNVAREIVKYLRVINDRDMVSLNRVDVGDWVPVWEREVQTQFDCERGPLWRATLLKENYDVTRKDYHITILFTFYHGIVDGMAVLIFAQEFVKCLERISKGTLGEDNEVTNDIPAGVMTSLASRQFLHFKIMQWFVPQSILLHVIKLAMRINLLFDAKNPIISQYGKLISAVGSKNEIKIIPRQLSKADTQKLIKLCRRNFCTVYGAMLACCHLAVAKLLEGSGIQDKNVRFGWYCPVNVRAQCEPRITEDILGSYTTVLMENVEVPKINPADSNKLWKFAKRCTQEVHSGIRNGRHLFSLYLLPVSHLLNPKEFVSEFLIHSKMNQSAELMSPVHSLTNLGKIELEKAQDDDAYAIEGAFGGSGAYRHGATFVNHMATFNGVFTWSTSYVTSSVAKETAEKYVDLLFEILLSALSGTCEE